MKESNEDKIKRMLESYEKATDIEKKEILKSLIHIMHESYGSGYDEGMNEMYSNFH